MSDRTETLLNRVLIELEDMKRKLPQLQRVLTSHQACAYLDISQSQLNVLISTKEIAYHKKGSYVRFTLEDLDRYLKSIRVKTTQEAVENFKKIQK